MTSREELYLTTTRLNRQLGHASWDDAQTSLQHEALAFLAHKKTSPVNDLAEFLGLSVSSMTQLVGRLVRAGQVKRLSDVKDRRIVLISLTTRGRATQREYVRQQTACLRRVFAGITDRQLKQVIQFQQRVLDNISHLS